MMQINRLTCSTFESHQSCDKNSYEAVKQSQSGPCYRHRLKTEKQPGLLRGNISLAGCQVACVAALDEHFLPTL